VADTTPEELRARYSSGYRIEARLAPGAREPVLAALERAGFAAQVQGDRLVASAHALDAEGLRALARALGPEAAADVHLEQASMNEVFRRLVRENGAAAPGAGS
jgi:hypothetical protein